jgi:hypothetical protein
MLALKLEGACECYANEDFEVVCESGDNSEKFLIHAHSGSTSLLSVREEDEQIDCLAAEHAGLPVNAMPHFAQIRSSRRK